MSLQAFISLTQAAIENGLIDEKATLVIRTTRGAEDIEVVAIDWANDEILFEY